MELEDEHWRLCRTTVVRGVAGELEDENWLPQLTRTHTHTDRDAYTKGSKVTVTKFPEVHPEVLSIFCVHSSSVFSVRFPAAVHSVFSFSPYQQLTLS